MGIQWNKSKESLTDVKTIHLLGVRVLVGRGFGCSSPLPSCIGFLYRDNYKIRDNIFGVVAEEVEAYLGSLYIPPVSVNAVTLLFIHITSGLKSNVCISIT